MFHVGLIMREKQKLILRFSVPDRTVARNALTYEHIFNMQAYLQYMVNQQEHLSSWLIIVIFFIFFQEEKGESASGTERHHTFKRNATSIIR